MGLLAPRGWRPGLLMGEGVSGSEGSLSHVPSSSPASPGCQDRQVHGLRLSVREVGPSHCPKVWYQSFASLRETVPQETFWIPLGAALGPGGAEPALFCRGESASLQLWVTGGPLLTAVVFLVSFAVFTFCSTRYYY